MDWKKIIGDLLASGATQIVIAKYCHCGQPTISEIFRGTTKNPSYRIGERLLSLHQQRCGDHQAQAGREAA